ncbi:OprD family outer membrane porin [Pseudomonas chlororaphis subsp. aureofaciens]|uniref:OprD family outer membrane porin n=1 Tax=Pseudomonas TaxID=286 RepID=UPI00235F26BD|nr:OprD family outer membrane porin [Pseudomonas sp. SBT1-2]
MNNLKHVFRVGVLAGSLSDLAFAAPQEGGFLEDSEVSLKTRTYYFNRDYRDQSNNAGRNRGKPRDARNGYREELTQGLTGWLVSGYTQGTVGFGLDAHAMMGLQLDSGGGRTGTGNLPVGGDGHPDSHYGKFGGALKMRAGGTQLKYGQMTTSAPVFAAVSNRTLIGMAYGMHIGSVITDDLRVEGGHFTAAAGPSESKVHGKITTVYGKLGKRSAEVDSVDYLGGVWKATDGLSLSAYSSRFEDVWRQYYLGASYKLPLTPKEALRVDVNAYRTLDTGSRGFGGINNVAASLALAYDRDFHSVTAAFQHVRGDQPFDYMAFGDGRSSASMALANSVGYSDFNGPGERSWQLRYDLDLTGVGFNGLSLYGLHARGYGSDGSKTAASSIYTGLYGRDGRHWETDLGLAYRIKDGPLAGLSLRTSQAWHRGNHDYLDRDVDETRLTIDYPLASL